LHLTLLSTPPAPPEIHALSLHDALPISWVAVDDGLASRFPQSALEHPNGLVRLVRIDLGEVPEHRHLRAREDRTRERAGARALRSEEHTSELQSQSNIVCRLLLEKKKHI